jgi:formate hydrogenlyase transcriptional activator
MRLLSVHDAASFHDSAGSDRIAKTLREAWGDLGQRIAPHVERVFSSGTPVVNFQISRDETPHLEGEQWLVSLFPIHDDDGSVVRCGLVIVPAAKHNYESQGSLQSVNAELVKHSARLEMFLDVVSLVSANWDLPQVFPRISARIRRVLRQEYSSFKVQDISRGVLIRRAVDFPLGKGFTTDVQELSGDHPSGHVMLTGTAKIFSEEDLHHYNGNPAKNFLAEGLRSLCCLPLTRPGGPLGVFVLGSTRRDAFQPDDLALLQQLAAQLSLSIENHRIVAEIDALRKRLGEERKYLEEEIRAGGQFEEIIGESEALKHVLDQVTTVSSSDATVLILGETGTGKELIARAIHRMSRRKDGPFIKLNCAAIPTGLLESELFGHEKGAFTGAINQKIGRMELADGGTLFLDEIGEIPLELQPKLLRVLQDQEFERLGSNRTIRVKVRLVAATNRDLTKSVADHEFRSDLFYRLNVFPIHLPALRDRREDIPILVRHFVRKFSLRMDRHLETIPKETIKALTTWSWPGNVRELENLMERSVILSDGKALRVPLGELRVTPGGQPETTDHTLDHAERQHIIRILRETAGLLSGPKGAAQRLGLKRTTLQSKMQRLKISRKDYIGPRN